MVGLKGKIKLFSLTVLMIAQFQGAFASESISLSSTELTKGYSFYENITSSKTQTTVQYGDEVINALSNLGDKCTEQAKNKGNNGEIFIFSACSPSNTIDSKFTTNTNLLYIWQAGREDIRDTITNKMKFAIYSSLFGALKNTYAYNQGYTLYSRDTTKLSDLNSSYYSEADKLKRNIATAFLNTQSGSYQITAMDFLWQEPEIAPKSFYTQKQADQYKAFEASVLASAKKIQSTTNRSALVKLQTSLLKSLKDKNTKMDNDKYALTAISYYLVLEKLKK